MDYKKPFKFFGQIIPNTYDITDILINKINPADLKEFNPRSVNVNEFLDLSQYSNWDLVASFDKFCNLDEQPMWVFYNGKFYATDDSKQTHQNTFPPSLCVIETKADLKKLEPLQVFYLDEKNITTPFVEAKHKIIDDSGNLYNMVSQDETYIIMKPHDYDKTHIFYKGDKVLNTFVVDNTITKSEFIVFSECKHYDKPVFLLGCQLKSDEIACECDLDIYNENKRLILPKNVIELHKHK
jgi:hypothetical protein